MLATFPPRPAQDQHPAGSSKYVPFQPIAVPTRLPPRREHSNQCCELALHRPQISNLWSRYPSLRSGVFRPQTKNIAHERLREAGIPSVRMAQMESYIIVPIVGVTELSWSRLPSIIVELVSAELLMYQPQERRIRSGAR